MDTSKQQTGKNIMAKNQSELQAIIALRCVKMIRTNGLYMAKLHAAKHGVSKLFRIARQLEAVKGF